MDQIFKILQIIGTLSSDASEIKGIVEDGIALEKRVKAFCEKHPELLHLFDQPPAPQA